MPIERFINQASAALDNLQYIFLRSLHAAWRRPETMKRECVMRFRICGKMGQDERWSEASITTSREPETPLFSSPTWPPITPVTHSRHRITPSALPASHSTGEGRVKLTNP